jgi:diguanylate cyclase (GGDEF)-like protein
MVVGLGSVGHGVLAATEDERLAALRRSFALVRDAQDGVEGAREQVALLLSTAERRQWPEVARAALFAQAVAAFVEADRAGLQEAVGGLRSGPLTEGDPVALSLALVMSASKGPDGTSLVEPGAAELARAAVLLEAAETDGLTLATAHNSCGLALGQRRLWELEDFHYAMAEGLLPQCGGTPLAATVVFNRAELQVNWACALREIGEGAGLADRRRAATDILDAASQVEMPATWRWELTVIETLFDALCGDGDSAAARRLLDTTPPGSQYTGHVFLALALTEQDAEAAERAVRTIPGGFPEAYDLALRMAAELEQPEGRTASAAMRYADRHARLRWETRLASLAVMRSLIEVERRRTEHDQLTRHAYADDLTGLANRRGLQRRCSELDREEKDGVAVLLVDVDDFKAINDVHGHQVGDRALIALAGLLSAAVRTGDLAARIGGDEFAVLLPNSDPQVAHQRADQIVATVARYPWDHIHAGLSLTVSVGVSASSTAEVESLLSSADVGLYRAKAAGGSLAVLAVTA